MEKKVLEAAYRFTIKDLYHPSYAGLFYKDGFAVATTAHILCEIKTDYPEEYEGTVRAKDGSVIEGRFPNYKAVIPDYRALSGFEDKEVLSNLYKAVKEYKKESRKDKVVLLKLDPERGFGYFDVMKLWPLLELFNSLKEDFDLYLNTKDRATLLRSTSATCIVMPFFMSHFNTETGKVYTLDDLRNFGKPQIYTAPEPEPTVEKDEPQPEYSNSIETLTKPKVLSIDIETYSPEDLKTAGVYRYASHPEFKILLFAYAFDDEPVEVVDLESGEELPQKVITALFDPDILKTAHNALFERVCLSNTSSEALPIEQWECTMVRSAVVGLPLSLGMVAAVLKLGEQKAEGMALINYFCKPCKPTKTNGGRTRNLPTDAPEKWTAFKEYCKQDVEVERSIWNKLNFFKIIDFEKQLYILDQQINDRGVKVDTSFIANAIKIDSKYKEGLTEEITDITDLSNPNSVQQLKEWLSEELGEPVDSLTKDAVSKLLKTLPSEEVIRVLQIRQESSKTSVKKYAAMEAAVCSDDRISGLLQFYGANRTGRWAGRLVQVQNLPQNHLPDLDLARQIVTDGDGDLLAMLYGNVPDTLSQLVRTAFIPEDGHTFIVADFSAIEARVIAWLAGEKWRLDVFNSHGKIYEASASKMFHVPIESVTKGSDLRQKGKVSELALGYQGGVGALEKMGAAKMGLSPEELPELVDAWRKANPAIVQLWADIDAAAKRAVKDGIVETVQRGIKIEKRGSVLYIFLPSGRRLSYFRARMGTNRFGSESVVYEGMNQTTKKWETVETYGGKLVENIVQAIARDCLAYAMLELNRWDYKIVMHVHDEVIIEVPEIGAGTFLEGACGIMGEPIPWAPGLPLRADGYVTDYYRKD